MQLTLTVIDGPETGKQTTISYGETLIVGRAAECGLALPTDDEISRMHFSIISQDEHFALKDLNSANQTHKADEAVELTELEDGDEIMAGQSTFEITLSGFTADIDSIPIDQTARFKRPDGLPTKSSADRPTTKPRATAINLLVIGGPHKGEDHIIDLGHAAVIGRGTESTIQLIQDEAMSRTHFSIDFTEDAIHLKDLGSANGTELNKREVLTATLKNGDVITAGDSRFHLELQHNPTWGELDEGEGDNPLAGYRNLSETVRIRRK